MNAEVDSSTAATEVDIKEVKQKQALGIRRTLARLLKYSAFRLVMLFITVVIGIFLTIMIANMGGYVDNIMRGQIRENLAVRLQNDQSYKQMLPADKEAYVAELVALEAHRMVLDQPFVIRATRFLTNALTLNLGRAINMSSDKGSKQVSNIISERLAPTLLLMGTADMILFFGSLFIALMLSRSYGSIWDKIIIGLSPTSAAPPWFYGIFLILIFAALFRILPFGGMISSPPPEPGSLAYVLDVLKHMILPVSALVLASVFVSIYNYRTFFLIYSSEDYVEMAKAKGLNDRDIERRYVLRPTLPTIITNFALLVITLWTGAIITESVFKWPGLGTTAYTAIGFFDTPVIVGLTIIYAYLLAMTVFLLEFIYAVVDPRVKIGGG